MRGLATALALLFAALAGLAAPPATAAAKTSKPAYQLKGFRSAHFGMNKAQVKAAILKDFKVKAETIQES
ncbi:hypothetical protein ACE4Z6_27495, partial [Salmonella enterica]|uniref:hypothetical protein n=1 Tax=Salmonella enterica TaxID=28901 RepID=UPI003D2C7BF9